MSALATIHVGLKQLGIDQEDARDLYERTAGSRSLREMSPAQHDAVIGELRRLGFTGRSKAAGKRVEGRFAGKLQAMWIAMWNLGLIADRTDAGLSAFVKRQTKVDHTRFLRYGEDASAVIDALKGWMTRERGVDWRKSRYLPDWTQTNGYRIATAQFAFLAAHDASVAELRDLGRWVAATGRQRTIAEFDDREWIAVMNELGVHVRRTAARAERPA